MLHQELTLLRLLRNAKWRWEPASESQRMFVAKRWNTRKVLTTAEGQAAKRLPGDHELRSLKKGEAANIITRLKHGAQVRQLLLLLYLSIDGVFAGTPREAAEGTCEGGSRRREDFEKAISRDRESRCLVYYPLRTGFFFCIHILSHEDNRRNIKYSSALYIRQCR